MAGGPSLNRAEIWWARLPAPDRTRPVVLVSRPQAYAVRDFIIVTRVTTRRRGLKSEVSLGPREGLARASVANCDDLLTIAKALLIRQVGALSNSKADELDAALKFALGLD